MTTFIYINRDNVIANESDGGDRPVITVLIGNDARDVHGVDIPGPSKIVYSKHRTLRKGYETRVWVETDIPVQFRTKEVTP